MSIPNSYIALFCECFSICLFILLEWLLVTSALCQQFLTQSVSSQTHGCVYKIDIRIEKTKTILTKRQKGKRQNEQNKENELFVLYHIEYIYIVSQILRLSFSLPQFSHTFLVYDLNVRGCIYINILEEMLSRKICKAARCFIVFYTVYNT